jgi:hypothetical protein
MALFSSKVINGASLLKDTRHRASNTRVVALGLSKAHRLVTRAQSQHNPASRQVQASAAAAVEAVPVVVTSGSGNGNGNGVAVARSAHAIVQVNKGRER